MRFLVRRNALTSAQGNRVYSALLPVCHSEYLHGGERAVQTKDDTRMSLVAVVPPVLPLTLSGILGRGHNAVILVILGS